MSPEAEVALLADLKDVVELGRNLKVLDVSAGTGAFTKVLARLPGLDIGALEPSPDMLAVLRAKLPGVAAKEGFTDDVKDSGHFSGRVRCDHLPAGRLRSLRSALGVRELEPLAEKGW